MFITQITNALQLKKLFSIVVPQLLNRYLVRKSNQLVIAYYDQNVYRYVEDSLYNTDPAVYSKLTEKFFSKTNYILDLHLQKER